MFHMDVRTNSDTLSLQPQLTCFITEKEYVYWGFVKCVSS
jgi:hypothetical protein